MSSAIEAIAAIVALEETTRRIAAAITTLGELLPTGMAVTVSHPAGMPAVVVVTYPNGETSMKQFQRVPIH